MDDKRKILVVSEDVLRIEMHGNIDYCESVVNILAERFRLKGDYVNFMYNQSNEIASAIFILDKAYKKKHFSDIKFKELNL